MKKPLIGGWLLGAVVFVVVLMMGTKAEARMYSFEDYLLPSTNPNQYLKMARFETIPVSYDNLLIRVDGIDESLADADYLTGSWHLGLTDSEGYVVGWAKNSSKIYEGQEGRLIGMYSGALGNGNKPVHLFLIYDSADSGPTHGWEVVGGQLGTEADLADGDLFFDEEDILFGPAGIRGNLPEGIGLLPVYISNNGGVAAILPHMVVDPIPEPITIGLLSPANQAVGLIPPQTLAWEDSGDFYDVYFGEDTNNLVLISDNQTAASFVLGANDLDFATTYYWQVSMMQEQELIESEIWSFTTADYECQTAYLADLNGDCKVDLADMALFCQDWLKESNRLWPENN